MMKLTQIEVAVWATPNGRHTLIKRCYTNPGMEHIVRLNPDKVVTSLYKGSMHHSSFKFGIHHLTKPSP